MTPQSTPKIVSRRSRPKKRLLAYFGANSMAISIFLHILFAMGATFLIVERFQKKHIDFHATQSPSHTEVEHKVQLAKKNNVESAPPDLKRIVTTDVSAITLPEPPTVPTTDDAIPTVMSGVNGVMGSGMGAGTGAGSGGGDTTLFGAPDGAGLQGTFYDFKQTSDKPPQPTGITDDPKYLDLLGHYLRQGWNDELLDPYYKSKALLYSPVFAISTRPSEDAPKAFGLEKEVQPGYWVIHYHGKVVAPHEGEYRLAGFGDNILVVKINGGLVLDAGWDPLTKQENLHEALPFTFPSYVPGSGHDNHDAHLKIGPAFHLEALDSVDMDVLIGDCTGVCNFCLLIQKVGNHYESAPDGTPILPYFQLGVKGAPTFEADEEHPPYSTTPEPWQEAGQ